MYRHVGKQVLNGTTHIADGVDEQAAALVVDALNAWCSPLNAAVLPQYHLIDPDNIPAPSDADYDWAHDVFVDPIAFTALRRSHLNNDHEHHISRQSDEYACSCGTRWPVDEGEDHP